MDGNTEVFRSMIADLQSRGLDTVMFSNNDSERDAPLLNVSDELNFNVFMIPTADLNRTWWPSEIPANLETALTVAEPIVNRWKPHPSLKGYITKDEPGIDELEKVSLINEAFRTLDPTRPAMPILIGVSRVGPIFNAAHPDVMLIDVYPVGAQNELCDLTMTGFGYPTLDFVDYIRAVIKDKPASVPLWVILQTHSFLDQLREPIATEVREQHWLAIGEGAKGIFWFIYSSQQGWKGLRDNPVLYTEVTSLTQRTIPLRDTLLGLQKTEDLFTISGTGSYNPYISTLNSADNRSFIVAVNKDCQNAQNLTIHSSSLEGQLRDLETATIYDLDSPIFFPPGDGKIFELLPIPTYTISGNASVADVTLNYIDGTPKIVTSLSNGSYSLPVSYNWSGTVTPSQPCFTFNPASSTYNNITANQTAQNYTPTFNSYSGCADINVLIAGANQGSFGIPSQGSTRASFADVNNGPVKIASTNAVSIMGAERVIYKVNGTPTSFSEMMGLPNSQLNTTYWFPWYNNVDLDTQLRFGNVSESPAHVNVYINNVLMPGSPFSLSIGESKRVSFTGVNTGPAKIVSDVNIVSAERVIYIVNGVPTSFSEMMGLPNSQLNTTFWFPWYNNVDLDTQLRFGNVSGSTAHINVTINNVPVEGSPFTLGAGQSQRVSFPGVNSGPVKVESDVPIVAAERVIYIVNGDPTSFSEMMGSTDGQLNTTYWMPWYNNVDLDTQLRFGNVSSSTASVHVFIGCVEMTGSPYTLTPGESRRVSFAGVNNGPVKIVSNVNIVAAERVIYNVNGTPTSFSEMMGLPNNLLNTIYWLPWYNNVDLNTQLRFGVP